MIIQCYICLIKNSLKIIKNIIFKLFLINASLELINVF
jgi:hypothetical protein